MGIFLSILFSGFLEQESFSCQNCNSTKHKNSNIGTFLSCKNLLSGETFLRFFFHENIKQIVVRLLERSMSILPLKEAPLFIHMPKNSPFSER